MAERKGLPFAGDFREPPQPPKPRRRLVGRRELAVAAGLAAAGVAAERLFDKDAPESSSSSVEWSAERVQFHFKEGDWEFFIYEDISVSLAKAGEANFHDFLLTLVGQEDWFKKLPAKDRQAYIDGLIASARQLNPGVNLDNFSEVKKAAGFKMPARFLADPNPARVYSKQEGGYSRLQELAAADGFPVEAGRQQALFEKTYASAQQIPPDLRVYLDRDGSEDSQPCLAPDVIKRLGLAGAAFEKATGYRATLTDIMRDPKTQSERNSIDNSTHVTARSFDVSNGKFLSSEDKLITWSLFVDGKGVGRGPNAALVESLRSQFEALGREYGLVLFRESTHWHVYVPEARKIDLKLPLASYLAKASGERVAEPVASPEPEPPEVKPPPAPPEEEKKVGPLKRLWRKWFGQEKGKDAVSQPEGDEIKPTKLEEQMGDFFFSDYQHLVSERLPSAEIDQRFSQLEPAIDFVIIEYKLDGKIDRDVFYALEYPDVSGSFKRMTVSAEKWRTSRKKSEREKREALAETSGSFEDELFQALNFQSFSEENRKKYADMSFDELLRELSELRHSQRPEDSKIWRAISQAWVKERSIDLIRRMSPADIERLGVLKGSTVHGAKIKIRKGVYETAPPFFDLGDVWRFKRDKKTSGAAQDYVDAILRLDIDSKSHSVDAVAWRQKQRASIDIFRRHHEKFGFNEEVVRYLTPEVMLSIIHAEFFSEFDSRAFVDLSPILFEPYNMTFGPALNDNLCSAGPVQLIESTFVGLLRNNEKKLQEIKAAEGLAATFTIPERSPERAGGKNPFDPDSFAEALVGNPDSVIFYGTLTVLDHTKPAFDLLFKNERFVKVWQNASDEERELFLGSLAPLAINGGGGRGKKAAEGIVDDKELRTLTEMARALPTKISHKNAARGGRIGFETTSYLIDRAD